MSNAPKIFRKGQTVTISIFDSTDLDERNLVGTEQAEVIGIVGITSDVAGLVNVRPFHGEDIIRVHIRDMVAA
ncbi:hypothetical protein MYRNA_11 [Mycobacterium phage Myrna]|uniref:Uncharacterized protein n=1 Tax=Mycobacterium phage Myrna TaxID=546805 RepID=B5LJ22_9CAUD|nr:gp11 [Mycobacterium phage Myrna]ACH62019.1 hypothetical protein MYRNA_11 [Mycobacterium phage Myrna]